MRFICAKIKERRLRKKVGTCFLFKCGNVVCIKEILFLKMEMGTQWMGCVEIVNMLMDCEIVL